MKKDVHAQTRTRALQGSAADLICNHQVSLKFTCFPMPQGLLHFPEQTWTEATTQTLCGFTGMALSKIPPPLQNGISTNVDDIAFLAQHVRLALASRWVLGEKVGFIEGGRRAGKSVPRAPSLTVGSPQPGAGLRTCHAVEEGLTYVGATMKYQYSNAEYFEVGILGSELPYSHTETIG